jgi:putative peptide zinc metalloprotease protein
MAEPHGVTAAAITASTRIRLYPLHMRLDGDEWCVGRIEGGRFVAVPPIAVEALRCMDGERTVGQIADRLRQAHGRDVDIAEFAGKLLRLGYVSAVDGSPVADTTAVRPTWPWLTVAHCRWAQSPVAALSVLVIVALGVAAVVLRPDLLPSYRDMFWSPQVSVVLLGNAAIGWSVVLLHELAHLVAARGVGVPGRIRFGTRLQFLVVQTEVTGVWATPRRSRVTVYLAGIALELAVAALAMLGRAVTGPDTAGGALLGAVALLSLASLPFQCMLFMRTDLYFVVQDLARCRNLYGDGSAYLWHLVRRVRRVASTDPSADLPAPERRVVRAYTAFLGVGTVLCVGFAVAVSVPVGITALVRATDRLLGGAGPVGVLDGAIALLFAATVWTIWVRAWWRRHGPRVTAWLTRRRSPTREVIHGNH